MSQMQLQIDSTAIEQIKYYVFQDLQNLLGLSMDLQAMFDWLNYESDYDELKQIGMNKLITQVNLSNTIHNSIFQNYQEDQQLIKCLNDAKEEAKKLTELYIQQSIKNQFIQEQLRLYIDNNLSKILTIKQQNILPMKQTSGISQSALQQLVNQMAEVTMELDSIKSNKSVNKFNIEVLNNFCIQRYKNAFTKVQQHCPKKQQLQQSQVSMIGSRSKKVDSSQGNNKQNEINSQNLLQNEFQGKTLNENQKNQNSQMYDDQKQQQEKKQGQFLQQGSQLIQSGSKQVEKQNEKNQKQSNQQSGKSQVKTDNQSKNIIKTQSGNDQIQERNNQIQNDQNKAQDFKQKQNEVEQRKNEGQKHQQSFIKQQNQIDNFNSQNDQYICSQDKQVQKCQQNISQIQQQDESHNSQKVNKTNKIIYQIISLIHEYINLQSQPKSQQVQQKENILKFLRKNKQDLQKNPVSEKQELQMFLEEFKEFKKTIYEKDLRSFFHTMIEYLSYSNTSRSNIKFIDLPYKLVEQDQKLILNILNKNEF